MTDKQFLDLVYEAKSQEILKARLEYKAKFRKYKINRILKAIFIPFGTILVLTSLSVLISIFFLIGVFLVGIAAAISISIVISDTNYFLEENFKRKFESRIEKNELKKIIENNSRRKLILEAAKLYNSDPVAAKQIIQTII